MYLWWYTTNSMPQKHKLAISLWLFHTDLWPEFYSLLSLLDNRVKLYIGLPKNLSQENKTIFSDLNSLSYEYSVSYHDNYGADLQSFLYHLQLIQEPVFLKIHTKKSMWGVNFHVHWRQVLLHSLLGNAEILSNNLINISKQNIGMVCHPSMILSNRETNNASQIILLCELLNLDYLKVKNGEFPAGNMFFGKTELFKKYFAQKKIYKYIIDKLKTETDKVNEKKYGTFCHALERLFGYICSYNEYKIIGTEFNDIIQIYNKKLDKFFSMIELYNDHCYLLEDLNVYGKIIDKTNKTYTIQWLHKKPPTTQKYNNISSNIITQQ